MGCRRGTSGSTYALPTMHLSLQEIEGHVDKFCYYVWNYPALIFLVTRVGFGIAGFKDEQIAPLFGDLIDTDNVALPAEWIEIINRR